MPNNKRAITRARADGKHEHQAASHMHLAESTLREVDHLLSSITSMLALLHYSHYSINNNVYIDIDIDIDIQHGCSRSGPTAGANGT